MVASGMAINAAWHRAHLMPPGATAAQRLKWHEAHAKHCACRAFTAEMRRKLQRAVAAAAKKPATSARKRAWRAGPT